jgi:retinol dehydrogenase 12
MPSHAPPPASNGQICLVTGGTGGLGRATAAGLAGLGARVVLVGRTPERAAATAGRIGGETGNEAVDWLSADLSSLADVRRMADEFMGRYPRLDVLVNNAGAIFMRRRVSVDGIELTLALNHLAYFVLTIVLLDMLARAAPARVINVASSAHAGAQLDLDDVQMEQRYRGFQAYARSKLANVLFTYELARRVQRAGIDIAVNAIHPGYVTTNIARNNSWWVRIGKRLLDFRFRGLALSPAEAARAIVYLATSMEVAGVSGQYFVASRVAASSAASYDVELARRLWEVSARLAGYPSPARHGTV